MTTKTTTPTLRHLAYGLVAVILVLVVLYPIGRVLGGLVWRDGHVDVSAVTETIGADGLLDMLRDTIVVVGLSSLLALLVGGLLAWLNERTDARMGVFTDVIPIVNFLLPVIAGAIGWMLLLSPNAGYLNWAIREVLDIFGVHLDSGPLSPNSWYAVILAYAVNLVPFAFLLISAGLRSVDSSMEEQARVSGAGWPRVLWSVTLPLIRPSIVGALLLMAWFGLALFSVPLVLAQPAGIDLLSVRIVEALRFQYPAEVELAVGLGSFIMVALGVLWVLQRRILSGGRFASIGGKGARTERFRLGRWRWLARTFIFGYLAVAVLLPFGALALVALNGYWTLDIDWGGLDLDVVTAVMTKGTATQAFVNSVTLAMVSATVAIMLAAVVAIWRSGSNGVFARISDFAAKVTATVSSTVLALGYILGFGGEPFFLGGTLLILMMAYLAVSLPEGSVVADAAFAQVGTELTEASVTSGAGSFRTLISIQLPLMLPGLLAGWALIFVRVIGDLQVSALLAAASNPVVGFEILNVFLGGSYAQMAALALVLTIVSMVVVTVTMSISAVMRRRQEGKKSMFGFARSAVVIPRREGK